MSVIIIQEDNIYIMFHNYTTIKDYDTNIVDISIAKNNVLILDDKNKRNYLYLQW